MVKVLLVDDHEVIRAGLKSLLESTGYLDVVGEASNGEEAVRKAQSLEPDIVVMDLAMPGTNGVQATRQIRKLGLDTKVLVLTIHDEDDFLGPALDAGAAGFLNKSVADTDLLGAIEAIRRGHSYLPNRAATLLARKKSKDISGTRGLQHLSPREQTTIELYARGFSTTEAAEEMLISPRTVEGYLARIKTKLGLHSRRELVDFAIRNGLLQRKDDDTDKDQET